MAAAAAAAQLDIPLGTLLGDAGAGLSTGQLRRVALAPALVTARPVLLLDEPTEGAAAGVRCGADHRGHGGSAGRAAAGRRRAGRRRGAGLHRAGACADHLAGVPGGGRHCHAAGRAHRRGGRSAARCRRGARLRCHGLQAQQPGQQGRRPDEAAADRGGRGGGG
ncbi:MAG: ATP-binding cassette domain-containing protein [Pseudonocardiaceae bacterium]